MLLAVLEQPQLPLLVSVPQTPFRMHLSLALGIALARGTFVTKLQLCDLSKQTGGADHAAASPAPIC